MDCMEKEFEEYWNKNQKKLILNAPKALRDEYIDSTKLDSPIDWVCFILPVALGIGLQPVLNIQSEILSWAVVLLIVVVCFAVLQLVKPMLQKKKSTIQVVKSIKAYYYEVYKKNGLKKLRVCHKSMAHPLLCYLLHNPRSIVAYSKKGIILYRLQILLFPIFSIINRQEVHNRT